MARIQVFQGGNIQRDDPRITPVRAADFGPSGLGEGLQKLGQAGSEAASVIDRINEAHDEAAAKEAMNAVSQHWTEIGYTGPNAYFGKVGKDALDTRPTVDESLDSFIEQTRAGLKSERQQFLFDQAMTPQRQEWGQSIAAHALKETRTYAAGESEARAGMTGELARFSYLDNPEEGEKQLDTQDAEIAHLGELQGWGPDEIKAKQLTARSGAYKDIGYQIANNAGGQSGELISAFLDKHGASMTGDDRTNLSNYARARQDAYEAEQRRIEAEQRRAEREARQDARDSAESAMARLDDGVPLSADEYAAAHQAAAASGDDQLVKRVEDGQFKNSLTLQYQNARPSEMQDELNAVSARIAKAGAKADHKDIIARDTLQTLLGKANGEISTDSLSYAAGHFGVQIGPLNFNDGGSITSRINAATQAAKQTGRPPQPLTNEEASQLSAQWHGDNTGQKVALALNLAKLGPLAIAGASQVAPNDAGFQNAVALATLRNQSVAHFRVNQIMTGQDVLKTKPKLIDRGQASAQFNTFVGGSLQFLPQVRAGVYSNATAILASDANQRGWNEWGEASPRWYAAVNMALGAYTKDGKQYGGLAKFNGAQTVLPEDMDQVTFETKIARSTGPQFVAASGRHTPVYANGQHPTATDIKKMQWVPVGDGRYRISDGHGFIRTTGGGFYEIDVRKLP